MTLYHRYFRVRIRNEADSADELVVSSYPGDDNPFVISEPSGDGQSIDPITGAAVTGSYSIQIADVETEANTRVITSLLADANGRQQLISRRTYFDQSENGISWINIIPGYCLRISFINAMAVEIGVGETRRRESNRTIFREATPLFPGVTCVIGGPVIGGFAGVLADHGGWTFEVTQVATSPDYVQLKLVEGFDPRKYTGTFTTISQAIVDYTNNWARKFFEAIPDYLGASTSIQGHFPGVVVKIRPSADTDDTNALYFTPLAEPEATIGPWWNPSPLGDNLTRKGGDDKMSLWLPTDAVDQDGDPAVFAPVVTDEFTVWVYATAISEDNPLHIYEHPVDLWEKVEQEVGYVAGDDYDDSVLPALKEVVGPDYMLALRIEDAVKAVDFIRNVIYGAFQLSTRVEDGKVVLFSIDVSQLADPAETITIEDLSSDEGTVFDLDQESVITAITLKTKRIHAWSSEDDGQPEVDSLVVSEGYPQTIENSDDDIPPGLENEVTLGDIPGVIVDVNTGPVSMEKFLIRLGNVIFGRFGRGAPSAGLHCLPGVSALVGQELFVDLVHRPNAVVGQTPVSQRGGPRIVQVIQRTPVVMGSVLKVVDSLPSSEDVVIPDPDFTASSNGADNPYVSVLINNADDLNAAGCNAACYYAISATEPTGLGTHFTTILWNFMTNPTFTFDVGPFEIGENVWIQMRSELPGGRVGPFTDWQGPIEVGS